MYHTSFLKHLTGKMTVSLKFSIRNGKVTKEKTVMVLKEAFINLLNVPNRRNVNIAISENKGIFYIATIEAENNNEKKNYLKIIKRKKFFSKLEDTIQPQLCDPCADNIEIEKEMLEATIGTPISIFLYRISIK